MPKPIQEQALQAFSVIDRAVSQLDCKGLSLMQARDLIQAMQIVAAYVQPEQGRPLAPPAPAAEAPTAPAPEAPPAP